MTIKLVTCIGTDTNISNPNLLYHFIEHYTNLSIKNWCLTLHSSGNPEFNNLATFEKILNDYHIPYNTWLGKCDHIQRVRMNNILVARHSLDDWFIGADFDEFIEFPCAIPEYLATLDQHKYNCVTGDMIDYIGEDGILPEIRQDIPLKEQFPLKFDLRKDTEILKEFSQYKEVSRQKKVAIKKPLQWWVARHDINQKTKSLVKESPERLKISHYPWDHLRLKRIENRQELNYVNKPSVYKDYEHTLTQQNRAKIIEYLQNHGKFNLKE